MKCSYPQCPQREAFSTRGHAQSQNQNTASTGSLGSLSQL